MPRVQAVKTQLFYKVKHLSLFKLWLCLAWLGFFKYEGIWARAPIWWPRARVKYKSGRKSMVMAIGNALEYARIFNGQVVEPWKEE